MENAHRTVNIRKLLAGSTLTTYISNIDRRNMQVNLDSADLASYRICNADSPGQYQDFRAVPHEYDHTFPGVDDEYVAGHVNLGDANSIMNVGDQIRTRYLSPILTQLNTVILDCTFRHP